MPFAAMKLVTTLIWLHCLGALYSTSLANNIAEQLYDKLLLGYYKDIGPCVGCGSPVVLNLTFHLAAINYLDEVKAELNTVGYLTVSWLDTRLSWNPANFSGIFSMLIPYDKIWTPTILVGNPSQRITNLNSDFTQTRILYNGVVIWNPGDVFHTRCYPDIYRYPFDEHECYIAFVPWGYLPNEVTWNIPENVSPLPFYKDNGEWVLKKVSTEFYIENALSVAKFYFTFTRRSQFVVVNVILPILLLGLLNCFVFAIPANSGERISFSITVFLSFAVFMSLVGDTIPKTSDPMALLSFYLLSVFAMSAFIMVCIILNGRVFDRDPNIPVSKKYKTLVRLTKASAVAKQKVFPGRTKYVANQNSVQFSDSKGNIIKQEDEMSDTVKPITWVDVSKCLIKYVVLDLHYFLRSTV